MTTRRSFLQTAGAFGLTLPFGPPDLAAPSSDVLQEFAHSDVQLSPGLARRQFEQTQSVLMVLNEDSLLKPWRLRAGKPAPGPDLGGWYDQVPPIPTPGPGHGYAPAHSFGQWVSALARGYATTREPATRARVQRLVTLYDEAISPKFYEDFRYPGYNYDKMVLGLIDAHRFASIPDTLAVLERTTDAALPSLPPEALDRGEPQQRWHATRGENATPDHARDETYTLPENLYIAYKAGAGPRYRPLADRFLLDRTFFDPLARGVDVLSDHHAYSYFNSLNSAMMAYLVTGSRKHLQAARFGFERIQAHQSFATGGWGPDESFHPADSNALYDSLSNTHCNFETPCGSYAHLKLTRYLLRVVRDGRYGDSMERVLYNAALGALPLQVDGRSFYYSDYNNEGRRSYFQDPWPCCSGTLPQLATDYPICCYFHDAAGIYVNLYLPSTLHWTASDGASVELTQAGEYPLGGNVALKLKLSKPSTFPLRLRIPQWAQTGGTVSLRVNGQPAPVQVHAGFALLQRRWKDGDRIDLELPMPLRLEAIDAAHPECVALLRGPLVLFALDRKTPRVTTQQLLHAKQLPGRAVWEASTADGPLHLVPFTEIEDRNYTTYLTVS